MMQRDGLGGVGLGWVVLRVEISFAASICRVLGGGGGTIIVGGSDLMSCDLGLI